MDVDLVYTWVNSQDASFQAERAGYAKAEVRKDAAYRSGQARTDDHGELRYSLRSVQRFLPFIRRIYVVHAGAAPDWLRQDAGDLVFVPQEEIVPQRYSPTFQSDVVEAFLYKIPGLAENYIYSNDDFFFSTPHDPTDFFDEEGRAVVGINWRLAGTHRRIGPTYRAMETNMARAAKRRLDVAKVQAGDEVIRSYRWLPRLRLFLLRAAHVNTMTHVAQPFRKSIWEGFHRTFREEIESLCSRRFRSAQGLTVNNLAHLYARATDKAVFRFAPEHAFIGKDGSAVDHAVFQDDLVSGRSGMTRFCLNDTPTGDEEAWNRLFQTFLPGYFPLPTRWER